ncbi:MAG: dihydroorotase, partial [Actinomycetota bacterium]|nr:dihydroorotase [Actinomycetota bacterium]
MARTLRIRNGIIQTPKGALEADVLIDGERISALLARDSQVSADSEIDATGLWVLPGLIDLHAHTRVPGYEYKEDYLTSSRAVALGGYT